MNTVIRTLKSSRPSG
ncbi:hypothetical protein [Escherichia coli]